MSRQTRKYSSSRCRTSSAQSTAIPPFFGAITVSRTAASDSGAKVGTGTVGVWLKVADILFGTDSVVLVTYLNIARAMATRRACPVNGHHSYRQVTRHTRLWLAGFIETIHDRSAA